MYMFRKKVAPQSNMQLKLKTTIWPGFRLPKDMNTLSPLFFLPRVLIFMTFVGFVMLLICDATGDAIGPIGVRASSEISGS
jgi:hypothetical protein